MLRSQNGIRASFLVVWLLTIPLAALVTGCGDDDDAELDAGEPDAGAPDAGALDASADAARDAGPDAGPPRYVVPPCDEPPGPFSPLASECGHFVDGDGRVVVMHGMNARIEGVFDVTFDDGRTALEPIPPFEAEDANRMRELGFNLLRLPINWSGVEPEDTMEAMGEPTYDEDYLEKVEAVLDLCADAQIFVLVDFHEDAYSKEIGEDGAPLWAISPPPEELLEGPLEDLGDRRMSPQVLRAFSTFYADEEGDGPRLRARFAEMAAAVAERFADHPAVIGYDIFNEPVASDRDNRRVNVLVAEAIREADPGHLVFFEPPAAPRVVLDRSPVIDPPFPVSGAAYAPHVYTIAFLGTEEQRETFTKDTLRGNNESARREASRWETPLLVGEWGYGPYSTRHDEYVAFQLELQDEVQASSAYWVWKEDTQGRWGFHDVDESGTVWTERAHIRRLLSRPMPERIAGWPVSWGYDRETQVLTLVYDGRSGVTAPTEIYLPAAEDWVDAYEVTCDGVAIETTRDPATGLVDIDCAGDGEHVVIARPATDAP